MLHEAGIKEPGLAERIHKDGVSDTDREKFKTNTVVRALDEMRAIKELKGWYIPFNRYGEHVVNAYHAVVAPKGATKIAPDTVQFVDPKGGDTAARRAAQKYAEDHDLTHVGTKKVWVDEKDHSKIIEGEDPAAVPAYQVKMQRQHTEFFDTEAMANRSQKDFADQVARGEMESVDGVRLRSDFVGKGADSLSGHMDTVMAALEKQDRFKAMSFDEKAAVRQTIKEASVRVLGATRLQSRFQQRRNVAGYSEDLGRVTADYARAATGYLAKLRMQPQIDDQFKALQKHVDSHKHDNNAHRRDELMAEMRKRIYGEWEDTHKTTFGKVTRRVMQISRLDKLAGVSFHVINSQEPWTTSLPVIGGRHGFVATGRTLGWAYNLIGARSGVVAGLTDTARAFRKDNGFTDYLGMFKAEIDKSPAVGGEKSGRLKSVLDYLEGRGLFSEEAVHEVNRYADPTQGIALRALDRADLMANQVGNAIEKINRTVTALAAYELEFRKNGGNHEAAQMYAFKTTHDTMGDYSSWNAAPVFQGNAGMLALQFKKFGHKTYYLLGNVVRESLKGNREAQKQFVGLMVTHAVVAGALGLPLEPFKVALMAANALGLTGFTYQDFEGLVRERLAALLGAKAGEAVAHGATRLLGVNTATRQGLDSLLTGFPPRDATKVTDLKTWLLDTMGGAPLSMVLDQVKSAQALMKGDFGKVLELSVPIKAAADLWKAGVGLSPTLDERGRQTFEGFSAYDAAVQAMGFEPSAKAENYAKRAQVAQAGSKLMTARSHLVTSWVTAKDKAPAFKAIQEWNKGQPKEAQILAKDLTSAGKRRANEDVGEIRVNKNTQHILDKFEPAYNTRPVKPQSNLAPSQNEITSKVTENTKTTNDVIDVVKQLASVVEGLASRSMKIVVDPNTGLPTGLEAA